MDWNFLIRNKRSITVTTDSRRVTPGCVFVALKGEHFDGNAFVEQAREDGAAYVICGDDALAQLQDLARAWRRQWGGRVIGVTGTNGKTTTKELLAAVLKTKYNLLYTEGNLNNQLGVPLTLLRLTSEHNLAVIEMGASHPGDIKELVDICEPDCGLVTNVGKAHLLGFGSFDGVKSTKAELYDHLISHDGTIFRNADNPYLAEMQQHSEETAHKSAHNTVFYNTGVMLEGTNLVGEYNSENVQAALCVGEHFGISRSQGEAAIRNYVPSNNRSQLLKTQNNTVVVDAYNANVTSMTAAITAFTGDTLILGDMLELGEYSEAEHRNIVALIKQRGLKDVFLVGGEFAKVADGFLSFSDVAALKNYLTGHRLQNRHILLKGSHGIHLETLIESL